MAQLLGGRGFKDKNSTLKQFEDENDKPAVVADLRNPMNYFKKHLISLDLSELVEVEQVFHSEILDHKFKILMLNFVENTLQEIQGIQQVQVWTAEVDRDLEVDSQVKSYKKSLVINFERQIHKMEVNGFLLAFQLKNCNKVYIFNLVNNQQAQVTLQDQDFFNAEQLFISNQYVIFANKGQILVLTDFLKNAQMLNNRRFTVFGETLSQNNREPDFDQEEEIASIDISSQLRAPELKDVNFVSTIEETKRVKIHLPRSTDQVISAIGDQEHIALFYLDSERQRLNIAEVDQEVVRRRFKEEENSVNVSLDEVLLSKPRNFKMHPKVETIDLIKVRESDNIILFILEKLETGFQITELDREISNVITTCEECDLLNWHFDPDTKNFILFYERDEEYKVKVFPLEQIMKQIQRQGGNQANPEQLFDLIVESSNSFQEEKLSSLAGLISPLSVYMVMDNYFIIGLFNVICIKDLNRVDSKTETVWKFFKKDPCEVYTVSDLNKERLFEVISKMDADLMYIYRVPDQYMMCNFFEGHPFILNFDPTTKEISVIKPQMEDTVDSDTMKIKERLRTHHFDQQVGVFDFKSRIHLLIKFRDLDGNEMFKLVRPSSHIAISQFDIQVLLKFPCSRPGESFSFIRHTSSGHFGLVYRGRIEMYRVGQARNEPFKVFQSEKLQHLYPQNVKMAQVKKGYIYILVKNKLWIICRNTGEILEPQTLGKNVTFFRVFQNEYIYWTEVEGDTLRVFFDYFNPIKQMRVLNLLIVSVPLHLNKRHTLRYDKVGKRFALAASFTEVKTFPLMHKREQELIGMDARPFEHQREIFRIEGTYLFRLTHDNFLKVWCLTSGRLLKSEYIYDIQISSSSIKQNFGSGKYTISKPFDREFAQEYKVISLEVNEATLDAQVDTKLSFMYLHRQELSCMSYLHEDVIKVSHDCSLFVAHKKIHEGQQSFFSYIVYRFQDQKDPLGYNWYHPVSRILHSQEILVSPCCSQFLELNKKSMKFEVQKINCRFKLKGDVLDAANLMYGLVETYDGEHTATCADSLLITQKRYEEDIEDDLQIQVMNQLCHVNYKTCLLDVPINFMQGKLTYFLDCPLSTNDLWPVAFVNTSTIAGLVEQKMVKQWGLSYTKGEAIEINCVPLWRQYDKIYFQRGTFFNENIMFQMSCREYHDGIWSKNMNPPTKEEQTSIQPMTYDLEDVKQINFCQCQVQNLGESIVRQNKKYLRRKKVLLDFSYFNWFLVANLKEVMKHTKVPPMVLKKAAFDVFPGRKNLLHYVCQDSNLLKQVILNSQDPMRQFSDLDLQTQNSHRIRKVDPYFIPFIRDADLKTPAHYSFIDGKACDLFLKYLAKYPIGTYANNFQELIPYFIMKGSQHIPEYLDSRIKQTGFLKQFEREKIKIQEEAGFALSGKKSFWLTKKNQISEDPNLFDQDSFQMPTQVCVVDLPYAHFPVFGQVNIYTALANTNYMAIFDSQAIRAMIEFQWPQSQKAIITWLMLPNVFFLFFLVFYVLLIFEGFVEGDKETKEQMEVPYRVSQGVIVMFIIYFAFLESVQMMKDLKGYFNSIWNYLDLTIILIISVTIILDIFDIPADTQRRLYAVSIFVMWIKTMYYLRVFRKVGYLTSMILKVLSDLKYFMLILAMSILAFANAFYILSLNNEPQKQFVSSFNDSIKWTYLIVLGEFDTDGIVNINDSGMVQILFGFATLFLLIVLLNLLISIISDTYAEIEDHQVNSMYQEMANLIDDNDFLTEHLEVSDRYLFIARPVHEEVEEQKRDSLAESVKQLSEEVKALIKKQSE